MFGEKPMLLTPFPLFLINNKKHVVGLPISDALFSLVLVKLRLEMPCRIRTVHHKVSAPLAEVRDGTPLILICFKIKGQGVMGGRQEIYGKAPNVSIVVSFTENIQLQKKIRATRVDNIYYFFCLGIIPIVLAIILSMISSAPPPIGTSLRSLRINIV